MLNKNVINKKGFTLVEMLLYLGLSALFIVIITEVLVATVDTKMDSQAFSYLESDYRYLALKLSRDINSASSISAPATTGQAAGTLTLVINGQNNTYTVSSNNLTLTNNNGVNKLNSSEIYVKNFQVTRLGTSGKYVKVTINLESKTRVQNKIKSKVLSFTVGLP